MKTSRNSLALQALRTELDAAHRYRISRVQAELEATHMRRKQNYWRVRGRRMVLLGSALSIGLVAGWLASRSGLDLQVSLLPRPSDEQRTSNQPGSPASSVQVAAANVAPPPAAAPQVLPADTGLVQEADAVPTLPLPGTATPPNLVMPRGKSSTARRPIPSADDGVSSFQCLIQRAQGALEVETIQG